MCNLKATAADIEDKLRETQIGFPPKYRNYDNNYQYRH